MYNLISFLGIGVLVGLGWVFSANRRQVNWRTVFWGLALQFIFAFFIFWLPPGLVIFRWLNEAVTKILSFSREGLYFLFGPLAISPGTTGPQGESSLGFILAIQALPTAIFFAALMGLLYYLGIMQKIVKIFTRVFTKLMKVSGAEALCAGVNIFVGIESSLTVRPYLEKMTDSELCTVLTAGMATIASTVLGFYVSIHQPNFPAIAGHLISASLLSAPAAIVMSKLLFPETEKPQTLGQVVEGEYKKPANWMEAVIKGANEGLKLCVGICALLLAFLGLLAMANWGLGRMGLLAGLHLSLEKVLSYVFYPLVLVSGVPLVDADKVSWLLAQRSIVTELVSYQTLAGYLKTGVLVYPRSVVIATYHLCGFAHLASLAIFVGGISALVPSRAGDVARQGFRALVAATLACIMTGAVAGLFFKSGSTLLLGQ